MAIKFTHADANKMIADAFASKQGIATPPGDRSIMDRLRAAKAKMMPLSRQMGNKIPQREM